MVGIHDVTDHENENTCKNSHIQQLLSSLFVTAAQSQRD